MYLWTSEAVSKGHPDKVADQIADTILDAYLQADPLSRVAAEVTVMNDFVLLSGEVGSEAQMELEPLVRRCICGIGYDRPEHSFDGHTVPILNKLRPQSRQIARAVVRGRKKIGAGDQGIMFGFATAETKAFMPLTHHLAFQVIGLLEADIAAGQKNGGWRSLLLPDAKSQVTVQYDDGGDPVRVHTVLISTCHRKKVTKRQLHDYVRTKVIDPLTTGPHGRLFDRRTKWLINPAGLWTEGGPAADTGLSGRKIVVDNYGADCPIGGGSFSGKDPTKVDRSAAYAARHVAKNLVAAGLARRARVQLSYAIGVEEPVSVRVEADGNGHGEVDLTAMICKAVDLTPRGIIDRLGLRRPIYAQTAAGGHFGRAGLPWERLDLIETFRRWKAGK
ncbi:MAG: methionine adenosyltransferase [Planctomycetota bacterium]